mmetsp:Transcript_8658/g.19688  ORF Transcript_8658/g.19688 Transcript_8658/m.19688 type:complete len:207 (+) Transcript_8658:141-761(+)
MESRPLVDARIFAGVSSCTACRRLVASPISARRARLSSSISMPSSVLRRARIWIISLGVYGRVRMITSRSRRSTGTPCGDSMSVPRIGQMPRFVANTTMGLSGDSSARFRYVKLSMSSMCTSSMNSTPGTISAFPSSRHSATLPSICSRTSDRISPVSPANSARNPCDLLLMTSTSWSVTTCTTSLRFCSSPSGHCTNFVCAPMAS